MLLNCFKFLVYLMMYLLYLNTFYELFVLKALVLLSSDLFFVLESRDVRETGDKISPSYTGTSYTVEKSPQLPGTNVPVWV